MTLFYSFPLFFAIKRHVTFAHVKWCDSQVVTALSKKMQVLSFRKENWHETADGVPRVCAVILREEGVGSNPTRTTFSIFCLETKSETTQKKRQHLRKPSQCSLNRWWDPIPLFVEGVGSNQTRRTFMYGQNRRLRHILPSVLVQGAIAKWLRRWQAAVNLLSGRRWFESNSHLFFHSKKSNFKKCCLHLLNIRPLRDDHSCLPRAVHSHPLRAHSLHTPPKIEQHPGVHQNLPLAVLLPPLRAHPLRIQGQGT